MIQNNYGFNSQKNAPGGLVDSSPCSVISRANGESSPIKPGYGVVRGDNPGIDAKLPVAASTSGLFEGVVGTGIAEVGANGASNNPTKVMGIVEWGKVWVVVADNLTISYGDPVYLIKSGAGAGKFTNTAAGNAAIAGIFIGGVSSGNIAPVKLYNAANA